jgi:hypothetical protein
MLWLAMLAKSESGTFPVQAPEYAPESSLGNIRKARASTCWSVTSTATRARENSQHARDARSLLRDGLKRQAGEFI